MIFAAQYDGLISFESVHQAILGEDILRQAAIEVLSIPTPRDIDISCGICLLFFRKHSTAVFELFSQNHIQWSKYYHRRADRRLYEKIGEYEGE